MFPIVNGKLPAARIHLGQPPAGGFAKCGIKGYLDPFAPPLVDISESQQLTGYLPERVIAACPFLLANTLDSGSTVGSRLCVRDLSCEVDERTVPVQRLEDRLRPTACFFGEMPGKLLRLPNL